MKLRLKDSVRVYLILFITIFSTLSLYYVCLQDTAGDLNKCLAEGNTLDYCNYEEGF